MTASGLSTPRLRVLAGPSPARLTDISELVNTGKPHDLSSERFLGRVVVHVRGFLQPNGDAIDSEYFEREDRKGVTWSIQVQGRFMHTHSADDVLFGNTFDRPLTLPWGSGVALKFMNYVDPTLEHDLSGPRPWALSPLIATMPHFAHERTPNHDSTLPPFPPPPPESITDDIAQLIGNGSGHKNGNGFSNGNGYAEPQLDTASKRRAHFADAKNRRRIAFGPQDVLTTDFCYGFLSFPSLALNLPGGVSFDLKRYWDGQPVRFVCVERRHAREDAEGVGENGDAEGEGDEERTFWCVVFEAAYD